MAATTVAFSDLNTWLSNQPANTASTPYELNITGLTVNDIKPSTTSGSLGYIIHNQGKYVDLSETVIPNGVTNMRYCFNNTKLVTAPVIPDGVTDMGHCFEYCPLVNASVIPDSVTDMNNCFHYCNSLVTAPVIPGSVTNMNSCFSLCTSLVNAPVIPDSVTNMDHCFYNCTSLVNTPVIPDGVTDMDYCFYRCSLSYKPVIPSTVTTSTDCYKNVTTNNWKGTESQIQSYKSTLESLAQTDSFELQYYDTDRVTLLKTETWVHFSNLNTWLGDQPVNTVDTPYEPVIIGLTTSNIANSADSGTLGSVLRQNNTKYVSLHSTTLPSGRTDMYGSFTYCSSLVIAPEIPNTVTDLRFCFESCSNLKQAPTIIPTGVTTMYRCFYECYSLTQAPVISNTVTDISECFQNCRSLETAPEIPNSVTSMRYAFNFCTSLKTVPFIQNGVTDMLGAFNYCPSLEEAPIIPSSVTNMDSCFAYCTSLVHKSIIPTTVTTSTDCYRDVTTLNWKGTESQVNDFKSTLNQQSGTFEVQIYNNDRVTYIDTFYGVEITSLSTWLSNQARNTTATPYEVMITCLTTSNCSSIAPALVANPRKYVDLSFTDIPSGASCDNLFEDCLSLTKTAVLPSPTSLVATYKGCINLQEIPTIPNSVTDLESTFEECFFTTSPTIPSGVTSMKNTFNTSKLTSAPTLPNGLLNMEGCFEYCFDLVTPPTIPSSVTNMKRTFNGCSSLTTAPTLPSGVTDLTSTFESTLLTTSPTIPSGVTSIDSTFKNCSRLVTVTNVPSTVTRGKYAFLNCSSLKKINEFLVSTTTLDSADFRDMFKGCTALEEIGHKVEAATDLHLVYLYFDSNSHVQGKIYSRDKTSVTIAQTTVAKTTLTLPILTDELLFDSTLGTTDIENIIEGTSEQAGMLDTHYSWFGKIVIPPTGDYFVLYAKDKNKFKTNLEMGSGSGIEVYPTEEAIIQDLPNLDDDDIVATYGDDHAVNDVPLGSIVAYWGTTDPVDKKWLVLDGRDTTGTDIELQTHYPSLYLHLGGTNVLPDLRECVPVGIGQNGTDTIATHDVYTLGQFKDDQLQDHTHSYRRTSGMYAGSGSNRTGNDAYETANTGYVPSDFRKGNVTHGKQKGVNWIIKAVSTADVTPLPSESIQEIEGYVEEYVDEKVSDIDNFKIIESSSVSVTLNANAGNFVTVSITVPNGYKSMFMTGYDISGCSGGINVYATESQAFFNKTGTFTAKIWVRNYTSSQLTATSITAYIMCLKQ